MEPAQFLQAEGGSQPHAPAHPVPLFPRKEIRLAQSLSGTDAVVLL